jgi:hypothetical protein
MLRRGHQLADGVEDDLELPVVFVLQFGQFPREIRLGGEQLAEAHEGADDLNADGNRGLVAEHRRKHGDALFGKGVRGGATSPAPT